MVPIGTGQFQVEVTDAGGTSTHRVTVPEGYPGDLGVADVALQDLVSESFRFLLQREPKEQIMREFELPVIARYFPEYPGVIADRLGG